MLVNGQSLFLYMDIFLNHLYDFVVVRFINYSLIFCEASFAVKICFIFGKSAPDTKF